jgi:hypothetical protein
MHEKIFGLYSRELPKTTKQGSVSGMLVFHDVDK